MSYLQVRSHFHGISKKYFDHEHSKHVIEHMFKGRDGFDRVYTLVKQAVHNDTWTQHNKIYRLVDRAIKSFNERKKTGGIPATVTREKMAKFEKNAHKFQENIKKFALDKIKESEKSNS